MNREDLTEPVAQSMVGNDLVLTLKGGGSSGRRFRPIPPWSGYALVLMLTIGFTGACAEENASNPLAIVNNTDVRFQYFDLDGPDRYDFWVADGAYMLTPKLKFKYELHYWDTDVTGSSESEWESLHIKPLYFPENWGPGNTRRLLVVS